MQQKAFVKISQLAGDEEYKSRSAIIDYTAKRMKNGEQVVGIPSLKEFIGAYANIAKHMTEDSEEYDAISELNKEYAFVVKRNLIRKRA